MISGVRNSLSGNVFDPKTISGSFNDGSSKIEIMNVNDDTQTSVDTISKQEEYRQFDSAVVSNPDGTITEISVVEKDGKYSTVSHSHRMDMVNGLGYHRGGSQFIKIYDTNGELQDSFDGKMYVDSNGNVVMEGKKIKEIISSEGNLLLREELNYDGTIHSKYEVLEDGTISKIYYSESDPSTRYECLYDGDTLIGKDTYKNDRLIEKFETLEDGTKSTKRFDENLNVNYECMEKDGITRINKYDENLNLTYESEEQDGIKTEKEYQDNMLIRINTDYPSGQRESSYYENGELKVSQVNYPEGSEIDSVRTEYQEYNGITSEKTSTYYREGSDIKSIEESTYSDGRSVYLCNYSNGSNVQRDYRDGILVVQAERDSNGKETLTQYDGGGNVTRVDVR